MEHTWKPYRTCQQQQNSWGPASSCETSHRNQSEAPARRLQTCAAIIKQLWRTTDFSLPGRNKSDSVSRMELNWFRTGSFDSPFYKSTCYSRQLAWRAEINASMFVSTEKPPLPVRMMQCDIIFTPVKAKLSDFSDTPWIDFKESVAPSQRLNRMTSSWRVDIAGLDFVALH